MDWLVSQAERATAFDGYRRFAVLTATTYEDEGLVGNKNRIPAVRLVLRDGDDVLHTTQGDEWDGNPTGRKVAGTR